MNELLGTLIFLAGLAQLSILAASALVPIRLNWKRDLQVLLLLHRQLYWIYGGYIVLALTTTIRGFGVPSAPATQLSFPVFPCPCFVRVQSVATFPAGPVRGWRDTPPGRAPPPRSADPASPPASSTLWIGRANRFRP